MHTVSACQRVTVCFIIVELRVPLVPLTSVSDPHPSHSPGGSLRVCSLSGTYGTAPSCLPQAAAVVVHMDPLTGMTYFSDAEFRIQVENT